MEITDLDAAKEIVCELIADLHNHKRSIKILDAGSETLWDVTHQRTIDVKALNARSLITWDRSLMFWNADAVIRLSGIKNTETSWAVVYNKALEVAKNLDIDTLATVLLQTGDIGGIAGLIALRLDRFESQGEINKRIDSLTTIRNFLTFIDDESWKNIDNLANHAKNTYNLWATDNKKPQAHITAKTAKERTKRKDENSDIVAGYNAAYVQFQQNVGTELELSYIPGPLSFCIPSPLWDAVAPEIWQKEVVSALRYLEPCLAEQNASIWKKFPYKEVRKIIPNVSEDALDNGPQSSIDLWVGKTGSPSCADKVIDVVTNEQNLTKILKEENARKTEQIIAAFRDYWQGMSLEDAAQKSGISYDTAKDYNNKIRRLHPNPKK